MYHRRRQWKNHSEIPKIVSGYRIPVAASRPSEGTSDVMHPKGNNRTPDGLAGINAFVFRYIAPIEMTGVLMRIFSFSLVSWLGPQSPFMFVWIVNTADAVLLSWCAILKKDNAYTILNVFWVLVGVVGILRAGGLLH